MEVQAKMKSKHHEEIQNHIWNRKGKPFRFSEFKAKIHGYNDFGGRKYKNWLKEKYGLKEFKKEGRVWLQKIPKKKKQELETNDNN